MRLKSGLKNVISATILCSRNFNVVRLLWAKHIRMTQCQHQTYLEIFMLAQGNASSLPSYMPCSSTWPFKQRAELHLVYCTLWN